MNYVLWFNKCKNEDRLLASRLSDKSSVDLVRFIAWPVDGLVNTERLICSCERCNRQLSLIMVRCTERTLDTALDAEPVLIERIRHSDEYCNNSFVHYSFAHPSDIDSKALLRVLTYADANLLYVTTTYNTVTDCEDSSVFKINLVRRKLPNCENHEEWLAGRIEAATHCKSQTFETRFISYFSPFTGDGLGFDGKESCHAATVPRFIESFHDLRCKKRNLQ